MLCAISGVPPVEPVASRKSGHVFEKRLIEKHITVAGTCPVTKDELDVSDLIPLKGQTIIKPRPPTATSIPGLVQIFQNEWDAMMLETYTLKQSLDTVRQELAHALYQHDAACRVIARLIKERDGARSALGSTQDNVAAALQKVPGQADEGGIAAVAKNILSFAKNLSKGRKKMIKSLAADVSRDVKKFKMVSSHPLHSASNPGILCLDIHATEQEMFLTGGADGKAILFNKSSGKIMDTLNKHTKKITDVKFHPTEKMVFTTSVDNTALIWSNTSTEKFSVAHTLKTHTAEVTGCTLHPSGSYLVTASMDKTWCFWDVETGFCRQQFSDDKIEGGLTKVTFHPDGIILGAGTDDSIVRIFEMTKQKNVANFKGHTGRVTAMSFSENGYYLASGDDKGVVKLWDLRKLQNFETLSLSSGGPVNYLEFDASGTYMGVGNDALSVYSSKSWDCVKTWNDHSKEVTAVKFAKNASFFASTSKDRNLKIFSE